MHARIARWMSFLGIDQGVVETLQAFKALAEPHFDGIIEAVYAHILTHPEARAAFHSGEAMARAREAQKRYWMTYVLAGNFGPGYAEAARRVGQTHFQLGVDLLVYMGTYSAVLDRLIDLVVRYLPHDVAERRRHVGALTRVVFMDMGLATSVYYESEVGRVQELSTELNASLARAGEFRDNETGRHILRMSRMCGALAEAIGKDADWVRMLVVASPLHDVGKIGIPDAVLLKPGRLDGDEMAVMRRHPAIGGQIIPNHSAEVIRMARRISLTHHERWDGTGYPTGLKGEEIPIEGRIAAICDVFDALVSARPYKAPWPVDKALDYLRDNAGTHFDPALVTSFLSVLPLMLRIQEEFAELEEAASPASA